MFPLSRGEEEITFFQISKFFQKRILRFLGLLRLNKVLEHKTLHTKQHCSTTHCHQLGTVFKLGSVTLKFSHEYFLRLKNF